jgi:hypothetical protein
MPTFIKTIGWIVAVMGVAGGLVSMLVYGNELGFGYALVSLVPCLLLVGVGDIMESMRELVNVTRENAGAPTKSAGQLDASGDRGE